MPCPLLPTPSGDALKSLSSELALDLVSFVSRGVSGKRMQPWNLLVLEIVSSLVRGVPPSEAAEGKPKRENLSAVRSREREKFSHTGLSAPGGAARHSRFGGAPSSAGAGAVLGAGGAEKSRRKNAQTAAFAGPGPASRRLDAAALTVLRDFADDFLSKGGFAQTVKSLKDEFRRDSGRVEAADKPRYFEAVAWFMEYQRCRSGDVGKCVVAMDLFSFNLAGAAADEYIQAKKAGPLSAAVGIMAEQVRHLFLLVSGSDDALRTVGMALMQRVYWDAEPRDRCIKVVSVWRAGVFTRAHLDAVMDLVHGTVKVLDYCRRKYLPELEDLRGDSATGRSRRKKVRKHSGNTSTCARAASLTPPPRPQLSTTEKHKLSAAEYSVDWYVGKLLSAGAVKAYATALRNFRDNSDDVNHQIATFMTRVCKLKIGPYKIDFEEEGEEVAAAEENGKDPKGSKPPEALTAEPILYSAELMVVYERILSSNSHKVSELGKLVRTIVRHFAKAAERNPLLYVEGLFGVGSRWRKFCEMASNVYLDEGALTGEKRGSRGEEDDEDDEDVRGGRRSDRREDDSDEEDEWDDEGLVEAKAKAGDEDGAQGSDSDSDEGLGEVGSDSDGSDSDSGDGEEAQARKRRKAEARAEAKRAAKKKKSRAWSNSEDRDLRSAVFVHGSVKAAAKALAKAALKGKSVRRIIERAKFLKLGAQGVDMEDVERRQEEKARDDDAADSGGDDDRWNEKRKYVPKSQAADEGGGGKRLKKAAGAVGDDDDDDDDAGLDLTLDEAGPEALTQGQGKKFLDDDDDDDGNEGATATQPPAAQSQKKKVSMKGLFDDDDDE